MDDLKLGDAVALVSRLLFDDEAYREGTVSAVAADGQITAEFPQAGFPSMRVTSAPEHFSLIRRAPQPLGYIVLINETGKWGDDWDGDVHPTLEGGMAALAQAEREGYTAVLTAACPVGAVPSVPPEDTE